jgi:hypothetical protein
MSNFLVNLARRGAGLPATTIQAPPPSPFGAQIAKHVDAVTETPGAAHDLAMTEQSITGNPATQAAWRVSSSEEHVESSPEAPTHPTPAVHRLSGTAPSTPTPPSVAEPAATIKTPSLEPPPAPPWYVLPNAREDVTAIEVAGDLYTPSSVVHDVEAGGQPGRHASGLSAASAMVIQESGQPQGVALPAPTLRPAPAESHTVLDLPRVPAHAAPTPSAQVPIHVRIGRVEVRATTASTPTPARPSAPAPVGFDAYYRIRNYRS